MTTNSKECELPAADSCAIMEGEDNEEEVVYSNKQSLLGKLKSLTTKVSTDFSIVFLNTHKVWNILLTGNIHESCAIQNSYRSMSVYQTNTIGSA